MANEGVTPPNAANDLGDLQTLGKYVLQKKIGAGGMGTVYLAVDSILKRSVAIKVLPREKASDPILVKRFKAEGQAGAHMEHPNIVSVYESGEINGYLYIVMEYIEGKDAYELLRKRGVLPAKRSLEIIRQTTVALQHAYERQVVHRDIKPSNLMIREGDGVVKLADMGLARIMEDDGDSRITRAGTTVGTVDYMSPEQARDSKAADIRSDIYSLGCTWYHLLTGKPPFPDGDLMNKLRAHAFQPIPDPRVMNEAVPEGIAAVIRRMMAKKIEDRYQNPAELLVDLNSPILLRSDFSADQLLKLGANTVAPEEDEADPTEVSTRGATLTTKSSSKPGKAPAEDRPGRSRTTDTREAVEEDEAPASRSTKRPTKRGKAQAGEELPPRNANREEASSPETPSKKSRPERALPGRVDRPALLPDTPKRQINPQIVKLIGLITGIVGLAVVLVLALSGGGSAPGPGTGNPYQTQVGGDGNAFDPANTAASQANDPAQPGAKVDPVTARPPQPVAVKEPTPPAVPDPGPAVSDGQIDQSSFGGVVAFAAKGGPLPSWVWSARRNIPAETPVIVVRRSAPANGERASLREALAMAGPKAIVEFADAGPHEMGSVDRWPAQVILRGREGSGAVLHWSGSDNPPVTVKQTTLTLEGLHLVFDPDQTGPAFAVTGGQFIMRRCSITNWSTHGEGLIVAEASGSCLIEDSFVRTAGSVIRLRGVNSSVVVGNSLLLSTGPTVLVESQDHSADTRTVACVATTALSSQGAVHCRHLGKASPTVNLTFLQSRLIHLPIDAEPAAAIAFQGWRSSADILDKLRAQQVQWKAERSTLVGWPRWASLEFASGGTPVQVETDEAWTAFWRQPTAARTLVDPVSDLRTLAALGIAADPSEIRAGLVPVDAALGDDQKSGVNLATTPVPPQTILRHIRAFASAPRLSTTLETPDPGRSIPYDLKKGAQFNKFLNSAECPDGSTVVAFGSGLRTIDPIVIKQKRIQIIFEQSAGEATPLTIQPGFLTEAGAARPAAWFAVEDGQLTLTNGSFRMPTSTTRVYPERFLQLSGGLAALVGCRVEASDGTKPVIVALPSAGHAPPQLLIEHSLITGVKHLVRVEAEDSLVELRQSVLAAPGGVALTLGKGATRSSVKLQSSTLYSGKSIFLVEPPGSDPVQILSQRTVYHGAAVMSLETDGASVAWWGAENAYSQSLKTYLIPRGATPSAQDFAVDWVAGWGPGHEINAISGPSATVLPTPPAAITEITGPSFTLNTDCQAAKLELGAPTGTIGPGLASAATSKPTPTTPAKPNGPGAGTPKPGPKKPSGPNF